MQHRIKQVQAGQRTQGTPEVPAGLKQLKVLCVPSRCLSWSRQGGRKSRARTLCAKTSGKEYHALGLGITAWLGVSYKKTSY